MIFPLPLDFFAPMQLSDEENEAFLRWGDSLLQQTIDAYHREQFDTPEVRERKWKPLKSRGDLTVYRRRKLSGDPNQYRYLCTGRIPGTLDEVVMGRYADNTVDFRRISGVYREDIVDCAVLGVIKRKTPEDPFFFSGFKWMTVKSPGKGIVKNRDVCWYEQVGVTKDRNGKEIGYTLTESVELPNCPEFKECVRAKFSICYLYKRNKSGGVKVYMRGNNDAGGNVTEWVTDLKSAELWLRIEQAMPVAHAVIATALVMAGKHTVRPFITTGKCEICHAKASGLMSSSKKCAVCHRLTCANCVVKVRVLSFHDFRVPQKELFCKKCLRLIHQVNLRDPRTVQNLAEYAAHSINGPEGSSRSFLDSERPDGSSQYTNDSGDYDDDDSRLKPTASVTSSDSGHGSYQRQPQPKIGGGGIVGSVNKPAPPVSNSRGGQPAARRPTDTHSSQQNAYPGSHSLPLNPVVIYDDRGAAPTSRSLDDYKREQRRQAQAEQQMKRVPPPPPPVHAHSMGVPDSPHSKYKSPPDFSQTAVFETRDSETPMTESRIVNSAAKYTVLDSGNDTRKQHAVSGGSEVEYEFTTPVGPTEPATTESLMAQIIRMNMIAEKSRQQIQDNLKIAQQLNMH